MRLPRTAAAVVLLGALGVLGACGESEPASPASPQTDSPTRTPDSTPTSAGSATPATAGPVAGSGAGLSPEPIDAWCAAITPEQLTALLGVEFEEVRSTSYVGGGTGCSASQALDDLSDPAYVIDWKPESEDSLESLRALYRGSATPIDVRDVSLPGGQPAITARLKPVRSTQTAAVIDGQVVRATLLEPYGTETTLTLDDYARFTEAIVAVYAD